MGNSKIDMTGKRIGKLVIIKYAETRNNQAYWLCKCDCGNKIIARGNHLRKGNIKSCGCLRGEENKRRTKHNMSRSTLYNTYHSIRKRCYLKSNASYAHYGGRGIKMCDEWLNKETGFDTFYNWAISSGYEKGKSIERIDVNKDYCPENCTWADPKQQANNRTNTPHITYNSESHTPSEWEKICGIPRQTILSRYKKGWSPEKIFDNSYWKGSDANAKT